MVREEKATSNGKYGELASEGKEIIRRERWWDGGQLMVDGGWWTVRGIFWRDWRMEVGRAGNGGNCGNGGNKWIDGGGTRCGKELTAWLGGDYDATDPAWCCGTGL